MEIRQRKLPAFARRTVFCVRRREILKKATVFFAYLTSPGNHRADGNQAGHALIFKLDHSMGACHGSRTPMERL